jgi:enoyl-CoA hydratase
MDMCLEMRSAWDEANKDKDVRVIILVGGSKYFCTGADLDEMRENKPKLMDIVMPGSGFFCDKPIIAAINGHAIGAGLGLACDCDIRIAVPKAKFSFPEVNVGFMGGGLELLNVMNMSTAVEMFLTGEPIDAERALRAGLLNRLVEPEKLMPEALRFAEIMKTKAPLTIKVAKRLIYKHKATSLQEYKLLFNTLIAPQLESHDLQEGIKSVIEKRPPVFKGE